MMLETAGLFGGQTKPGDKWNARGYFENEGITQIVVDLLRSLDVDGLGKRFYPHYVSAHQPGFREAVHASLIEQGWDGRQRWYYKNNKTLLTWRVWHHAFPNARWVIVKRDEEQIIRSCLRTEFMDAYDSRDEWRQYLNYHLALIDEIKSAVPNWHEFSIDRVFESDENEVREMVLFTGCTYQTEIMRCIERRLWNAA